MATASPPKPIVFLSASYKDRDWSGRLKAALATDGRTKLDDVSWDDVSSLDDPRITVSAHAAYELEDSLEDALMWASVAVLLLSPDYLASANAIPELVKRAKPAAGSFAFMPAPKSADASN